MELRESWRLAKVVESSGDAVKVQMLREDWYWEEELDQEVELELPTGSASVRGFDFLPEVGSVVILHTSRYDPSLVYLASSMPTNRLDEMLGHQSDTSLDPEIKCILLKNKNGIKFSPDAIEIAVQKKTVQLLESDGAQARCDLPIQIFSNKSNITLQAKKIEAKAEGEIVISGGMSSIIIGDAIDLKSTIIQAN